MTAKPLTMEELRLVEETRARAKPDLPYYTVPIAQFDALLATIRRDHELIRFAARHFDVHGLVDGSEDDPAAQIIAIVEAGDG